ncbi:uncharacterized protein EI90DRAFT_3150191 [Cantharellus anzutake]|uniref:uncharacterized protein n=1 Tax=Cantharellus anzutake TaxID=1750568 RepID=UPI0019035E23|nr:uncharacterized protein EI90DRAFT_3150191 [Cantharellus anzutake]KAF8342031.1 hypothetical protein EI90DRAFT_3150191 [Cantharellus anzutake]
MTVTHRKATVDSTTQVAPAPISEPGVAYQCDSCGSDITHAIRKEVGQHKPWHDYRVIERHSYPIFTEGWGADEELLLIEGLIINGLGNWAAAAEHIGTRTPEEVQQHYHDVYVESQTWPLPDLTKSFDVDPDFFHNKKKERIAAMRQRALEIAKSSSDSKPPLVSGPTNHETQGYMPGRLEFETEIENEAEELVKDLEFGLVMQYGGDQQPAPDPPPGISDSATEERKKEGDKMTEGKATEDSKGRDDEKAVWVQDPEETPQSAALKLALLDIYFEKLDRRAEARTFVFDRGMLDFKKWQAAEKKRPKEERDLIQRHKSFSKLQTGSDFEDFINGVMQENALKARILELQEYRNHGITTLADAEKYTKEKATRFNRPASFRDLSGDTGSHHAANGRLSSMPPAHDSSLQSFEARMGSHQSMDLSIGMAPKPGPVGRRPAAPLNLANAASLHLLTPLEQELCSELRILPKPFLIIKETLVSEFMRRNGNLKKREARDLIKIDVNKTGRIWEFLEQQGLLDITKKPGASVQT